MSNFEFNVTLPTNGFYYDDKSIKDIVLRDMTTEEEKIMLGSTNDEALNNIISACIISPKGLDVTKLLGADLHYLLLQLRIHTYGSLYKVSMTCPHCGNQEIKKVDLDQLHCITLDKPLELPIEFELPRSKDKIACRLLTEADNIFINNFARKLSKSSTSTRAQIAYDLRMAKHIVKINDEDVDDADTQKYVKDMHGYDSAYFWWNLDQVELGYDTTIEHVCGDCGRDYSIRLPMTREFFRPSFD